MNHNDPEVPVSRMMMMIGLQVRVMMVMMKNLH